jgi:hypothetical protein
MKCNTCAEEISPKFTAAIAANSCPFCGQEIMSQQLQEILTALQNVFREAADYMEQVEDWLAQNFSLKKVREDQVVIDKAKLAQSQQFNFPGSSGKGGFAIKRSETQEDGDLKENQPQTIFSARAGLKSIKAKKDIEFIMSQGGGAADASEFVGVDDEGQSVVMDRELPVAPPLYIPDGSNPLEGMFGEPDEPKNNVLEMDKLKRLQRQQMSTFGGSAIVGRRDE